MTGDCLVVHTEVAVPGVDNYLYAFKGARNLTKVLKDRYHTEHATESYFDHLRAIVTSAS